jgi:hypothetical protein
MGKIMVKSQVIRDIEKINEVFFIIVTIEYLEVIF